jgi:hypothetical protein
MNDVFSDATAARMEKFQSEHDIFSKRKLSLVIQFTKWRRRPFPLNAADFQTDSKGQSMVSAEATSRKY